MGNRISTYKYYTTTVKSYLCRKYGKWKVKHYKNCLDCPAADPETGECYIVKILKDMEYKKYKKRAKHD